MRKSLLLAAIFATFSCGCHPQDSPADDTPVVPDPDPETPAVVTPAFAKGADISWASEMEAGGRKFKKKDGTEAPLLEVLKDCGMNAIRLRVWVDPYKGWSGKDDVVAVAQKVKAAGMALMVDFHYSDFFADPSRQQIPAAWAADKDDLSKMCRHVADHTTEVLEALKAAGVTVAWVQIGNETRNGMLWPAGQLWTEAGDIADGRKHFAQLYNAGYEAAKAVFPAAVVMPHINNAYADNAWWFQQVQAAGAHFDAIALSHYPQAEKNMTSAQYNQKALANVQSLAASFKLPVYITEVGVMSTQSDAASVLSSFMTELRKIDACKGIFYWEPQVDGNWKPAVYSDAAAIYQYTGKRETWNAYKQGAFTSAGAPSAILDCFAD